MVEIRPRIADTVFTNARVLTMDDAMPHAEAVAVSADRIVWVGSSSDAARISRPPARVIDCDGGTLLPGFHDAHIHLLAYASSLISIDCRPSAVASIADIQRAIRVRAERTQEGEWIRGWGYDETALSDTSRHPTRWDLDEAASHHPIRINHRSGHAAVLNSAAMERVGIGRSTPEPEGATIDRDLESGEPNGLLFEMNEFLEQRIPPISAAEMRPAIQQAARQLLRLGITSTQDATHTNGIDRWRLLSRLRKSDAPVMPRITMMAGSARLTEFTDAGMRFGSGDDWLRLGHAKIMATQTAGRQSPSPLELRRIGSDCAQLGFPVAIHSVEARVALSAANAIENLPLIGDTPHRMEHCAETPPYVFEAITRRGATVVTQPAFVYYSGDRYTETVDPEMLPYLYRQRTLAESGVRLVFSSDAPVIDPDPMRGIAAAVTRHSISGAELTPNERTSLREAFRAYTAAPAFAAGIGARIGTLAPGALADIVVFDRDLMAMETAELGKARAAITMLAGEIVSE